MDDPHCYVRLSELEKVSRAFLTMIDGFDVEFLENIWAQTRYTDMALYEKGVFCSEDLERIFCGDEKV